MKACAFLLEVEPTSLMGDRSSIDNLDCLETAFLRTKRQVWTQPSHGFENKKT